MTGDDLMVTTVTKKKRKGGRRRRRHYITGTYNSTKCTSGPINYRSSWELSVAQYLDLDTTVATYQYEALQVPYLFRGKTHTYYPDFIVQYNNGKKVVIEVKRKDKLLDLKVVAKQKAVKVWCASNGYEYVFWTNLMIEAIRKSLTSLGSHVNVKGTSCKKQKKPKSTLTQSGSQSPTVDPSAPER